MLLVKIFSCNTLMSVSKICCIQVLKFKKNSLYRLLISCICNNLSYHKHARNMHVLISNYNHPIECNKLFLIACVMQILLNFEVSACVANFYSCRLNSRRVKFEFRMSIYIKSIDIFAGISAQ